MALVSYTNNTINSNLLNLATQNPQAYSTFLQSLLTYDGILMAFFGLLAVETIKELIKDTHQSKKILIMEAIIYVGVLLFIMIQLFYSASTIFNAMATDYTGTLDTIGLSVVDAKFATTNLLDAAVGLIAMVYIYIFVTVLRKALRAALD